MNAVCEFASVTKFVEFIKSNYKGNIISAALFFENDDAFKNQFDRICIKPIYIVLNNKNKPKNIYLTHKEILEKWNNKILIVSFGENENRKLPKEKGLICELVIDFKPKVYKEQTYYDSCLVMCANQKNIDMLKKNVIKTELAKDTEELPSIE